MASSLRQDRNRTLTLDLFCRLLRPVAMFHCQTRDCRSCSAHNRTSWRSSTGRDRAMSMNGNSFVCTFFIELSLPTQTQLRRERLAFPSFTCKVSNSLEMFEDDESSMKK